MNTRPLVCARTLTHTHTHTHTVDYGITAKSVRDIWNMRTWGWATIPYWTEDDKRRYPAHVRVRVCACVFVCVFTYIHTHIYTQTQRSQPTQVRRLAAVCSVPYKHMHVCISKAHTCIHVCVFTTKNRFVDARLCAACRRNYIYMHTHTHTHTHTHQVRGLAAVRSVPTARGADS